MGAPALIDAQSSTIIAMLNAFRAWHANHADGGFIADNSSAIATSVATLDVDHTVAFVTGGGDSAMLAAGTSTAIAQTFTFSATSGKNAIAAVVVDFSGSAALKAVWGEEADTGDEVAPTDAEISADLGHDNWCRLADVNVEITGAATGTFTVDNTARRSVTSFLTDLAADEASFSVGGEVIPVNRS